MNMFPFFDQTQDKGCQEPMALEESVFVTVGMSLSEYLI